MTKSNQLEIVFIVPFLFRYRRGIERSATQLVNTLARDGHSVTVFTWQENTTSAPFALDSSIRIRSVPNLRYFRALVTVPFYIWWLLTDDIDHLFLYFAGYGEAYSIRLSRLVKRFSVNFIVGYPYQQVPHRFEEFRQLKLESLLDHIIVKSPPMIEGVAAFFGRNDIHCIPNGVDIDYFFPGKTYTKQLRAKLSISEHDRVLLTVAALEKRKGVQHVINILPALNHLKTLTHYVVVGDGPYRPKLEAMVTELNLQDRVHFIGSVIDVRPYYEIADLFLLLSSGEGFPNVILEAWSMGLPIITSCHHPYPDIVPSDYGDTIEENDFETLIAKIISRTHPSHFATWRVNSSYRKHVVENYAWSVIAEQHIEVSRSTFTGIRRIGR